MKPTKTQMCVLRRMKEGEKVLRCVHSNINTPDSFFFSRNISDTVRSSTIFKLKEYGLIEDTEAPEWRWRGSTYAITEAGRSVVDSSK